MLRHVGVTKVAFKRLQTSIGRLRGRVVCGSFSRMSERQYSLRTPDALAEPIVTVEIDTSNGVMFPLYDPDTNLVYLCGKGDSVIRYFEVSLPIFSASYQYCPDLATITIRVTKKNNCLLNTPVEGSLNFQI